MANIRVYPYLSPRLIEVLAPDTEITIQELVNLCRDWEDEDDNMSFDRLIDAAGKENLGGGVTVGITATLNNAQLFFEPRSQAVDDGSGRTCDANDVLGRTLYVNDATFVTTGVTRGNIVYNATTGSSATILEVVDENTIKHLNLQGGTSTQWTVGDEYIIFEEVQCSISGGNLVAVDDVGADLNSVFPSFGVQIVRTSSSSATLQELEAIQFSSFEGGVWVDPGNVTGKAASGQTYPTGTRQQPCLNQIDAHDIAEERGLNTIFIIGNLTLSSDVDWSNHKFIGEAATKTNLIIPSLVTANNNIYQDMYISGTLDGTSLVERCTIGNLVYVQGYMFNCSFDPLASMTLGSSTITDILQCFSGRPGVGTPIINCNGSGQISLRDYNGGIRVENCTSNVSHSLDMNSGQVVLDSASVTAGTFVVRGVGKLIDENGTPIESGTWNGGVTIVNELLTKAELDPAAIWGEDLSGYVDPNSAAWKLRTGDGTWAEIAARYKS